MEADSDDAQSKLSRFGKKSRYGDKWRSKLESKAAQALRVIREDAEDQLSGRIGSRNLVQLVCVIEGHGIDTGPCSIFDEGHRFARISKDNPVGTNVSTEDL